MQTLVFQLQLQLVTAKKALASANQYTETQFLLSSLYICMVNTIYLLSSVETPRKFIIAELSTCKLESLSVLLALMKIRAYGSKALQ